MEKAEIPGLVLEAWNRRDLDSLIVLADPEIEYVNAPTAVEPGIRRGHDGLKIVVRAQWEGLEGARQEIDRIYVLDDEIISSVRVTREMPGSDARIHNRALFSWKFREGRVIRLAVLGAGSGFDAALEAAGLED